MPTGLSGAAEHTLLLFLENLNGLSGFFFSFCSFFLSLTCCEMYVVLVCDGEILLP